MANLQGFNAANIPPSPDRGPIPAGRYTVVITDSEMRPNKAGTGSYLQLTFEVVEGEYSGRRLWARLNLDNPNPVAAQIAQADLAAICRAVGVLTPEDSEELHNIQMVVRVIVKRGLDGQETNEIRGYMPKQSSTSPHPSQHQSSSSHLPWKRSPF